MSKILRSPNLLRRETPEALDRRILLAGALAAARNRRSRRVRFWGAISGVAAAVAIAAVTIWSVGIIPGGRSSGTGTAVRMSDMASGNAGEKLSEQELLEFSDWTSLEQENYNLASQLNCYQDVQDGGFYSQV